MKKALSIVLSLCLCAALLPTTAKATSRTADEAINWVKSQVGHSVGYDDGTGYYQCVEFIQAYYEWLGVDTPHGNGADYASNTLPSGWTRIAGGTPQKGDILVYSRYSASAQQNGHVAIYESDSALYDQDGSVYGATVKKEAKNYRTYTYNYWGCIHPNFASSAQIQPSVTFSPWESSRYTYIGETDAAIGMTVSVSNGKPSYVGVVLYNSSGSELARGGESNTYIGPYYFKINDELNYTLKPGTTYKYKFYAIVGGETYWSGEESFKTDGSGVPQSTRPYVTKDTYAEGEDVTIKWNSVSDATSYWVNVYANWTNTYKDGQHTVNESVGSATSYRMPALKPGKYRVFVEALNESGSSPAESCEFIVIANEPFWLSQTTLEMSIGSSATLSANGSSAGTAVSWSSSNPNVASVSDGKVNAIGAGRATITATAKGKSAYCVVTVSAANVAVTSVTLSQSTLALRTGADATLTAAVNPANAADKAITWSSNNPSVATVSDGKVVAVKEGTATITATAGGKKASCVVQVSASTVSVESVTLNQTAISLKSGESQTLTATVNPSNATDKTIAWSSSNPNVATVSDGKVVGVSAGSATITASVGGKTVTCIVTVAQGNTLQIGTANISAATVGASYTQTLIANSADPVTWSVTSGALPSGLTLSGNGVISGTPTSAGTFQFTVTATGKTGTRSKSYVIEVKNANAPASAKVDVHFERKNIYHQDQFADVKANQWFTDTVASAFELGLMKGNSASTFNPYGDVTVAEAITMAARIHSINATGTESFTQTETWYQVYLDYAYQNGIISYAYYNSDVTQKATRAQFAEIFAAALPSENLYAINQIADNAVPDVSMSANYASSVYTLYRAGILTGSDALGSFNPQTYITRAETATILSRVAESNNRVGFSLGN